MKNIRTARKLLNLRQGRTEWYRIKNEASGPAEVYIYDEIGYFGVTADSFVRDVKNIGADRIELHLNSPGGDVFDGIAIYNVIREHPAEVAVSIDGLAASAASFIAMAGDEINIARNAEMMVHDAHGVCVGNAADMRDLAERMDKVSDNIASIYAERTGATVAEWRERMLGETWYSAEEAVSAGLADSIYGPASKIEADNSWDLSIFNYSGRDKAPAPKPVMQPTFDYSQVVAALKEAGQ